MYINNALLITKGKWPVTWQSILLAVSKAMIEVAENAEIQGDAWIEVAWEAVDIEEV
jgi:hypothetical protein